MIINIRFYLLNWEMAKNAFLFEFGYIIFRGWGKPPLPWDIFASDIPYIQMFNIAFVSNDIVQIEHSFKWEYAEKKAIGEHQHGFLSILPKPYLA